MSLPSLLRLREIRTHALHTKLRAQQGLCDQAQATVQACAYRLTQAQQQLAQHEAYTLGAGSTALPRLAPYFSAFALHLADQLERLEYALIEDEQNLQAQQAEYARLRQAWLRAQSGEHSVQQMQKNARLAAQRRQDVLTQNELDEIPCSTLVSPL